MVIEGVVGRSYRGDIAIDDVTMTDGICPGCKYTTLIEEKKFQHRFEQISYTVPHFSQRQE